MTWILLATLVASGDLRVEPALSDSITIDAETMPAR